MVKSVPTWLRALKNLDVSAAHTVEGWMFTHMCISHICVVSITVRFTLSISPYQNPAVISWHVNQMYHLCMHIYNVQWKIGSAGNRKSYTMHKSTIESAARLRA